MGLLILVVSTAYCPICPILAFGALPAPLARLVVLVIKIGLSILVNVFVSTSHSNIPKRVSDRSNQIVPDSGGCVGRTLVPINCAKLMSALSMYTRLLTPNAL